MTRYKSIGDDGTLEDARETNDIGISDIDRCVEYGDVIRQGRLIR